MSMSFSAACKARVSLMRIRGTDKSAPFQSTTGFAVTPKAKLFQNKSAAEVHGGLLNGDRGRRSGTAPVSPDHFAV
jgi:hypothetical protein